MAKSIKQQIADIQVKIDELQVKKAGLEGKLANEVNEDHLVPGATIAFQYGKGDNKRDVTGSIVAVKEADPAQPKSSKQIKVAFGEGFDAQFTVIYVAQVGKVISSPVAPVEAPTETEAV